MKKRKLVFPIFILVFVILAVYLKVPRMISKPDSMLRIELNKKGSQLSDFKVKVLLFFGADASRPILAQGGEGNLYNFILMNAIYNNRVNIIPSLEGNYTKEQKKLAYAEAKDNKELKKALIDLFNNKKEASVASKERE